MRSLHVSKKTDKKRSFKRFLGVSEAVGTVLLLGISITIAGGIALWTSQIDEGEENIYVDLWATVRGTDLVIIHRGGDEMGGRETRIMLSPPGGSQVINNDYTTLSGTGDDKWTPGEELVVDISGPSIPNIFKVVVVTPMANGENIVVLSTELVKSITSGNLPDLAISLIQLRQVGGPVTNTIFEDGIFEVFIRVDNFGASLTEAHMQAEGTDTVSNLRIFDSEDPIDFQSVDIKHFDSGGTEILETSPDFGIMASGDHMEFLYLWGTPPTEPRSLGIHTLNVKVLPVFEGELNYRNNNVGRKFRVDKELTPVIIHGPDPGIYDIYFSNDAPNSGEEVTVTVIVQNSGDEPVTPELNVNLIVTTWEPIMMPLYSYEIPDWKMDYEDHYGNWRSQDNDFDLTEDTTFPTCVRTNIQLLPGAYLFYYFTLEARVDVPGGEQWIYAAIDVFNSNTKPQGISFLQGDDPDDNKEIGKIQVLPRIMVVDDDNVPTGSEDDMTSLVLESLVGSGVSIDKLYTAQQVTDLGVARDAPAFRYNQEEIAAPAMEDFDIVIWVTGYDQDPLTNRPVSGPTDPGGNIQEIMRYLDSNKYFLLVGTSPFDGFYPYFDGGFTKNILSPLEDTKIDASIFLHDYLGIKHYTPDVDLPAGTGQHLFGMDLEGITPGEVIGDYTIELLEQLPGNFLSTMMLPRESGDAVPIGFETPLGVLTTEDQTLLGNPNFNMIRSWSTPDEDLNGAQFRSVTMTWDISQIKYLNEKIDITANVLDWFDWKVQVGRDLSVTRMNLYIVTEQSEGVWIDVPVDEFNVPKYLDTVLIEAYVRNNGASIESTSIMFYVTGPDGVELPVTPNIPDPKHDLAPEEYDNPSDINIVGGGGEEQVYKLWLAVGVGTYTFRVVVDPFHLISEINEENNDISYSTSTITSFVTKNNILVVDDDFSDDNFDEAVPALQRDSMTINYGAQGGEPSQTIMDALITMDYDYDEYTVENKYEGGAWNFDSDLSILDLKRYNSVLWVQGDSGTGDPGRETFTDRDIKGIKRYLDGDYAEADYLPDDHHENLMIIGKGFMNDLTQSNDVIPLDQGTINMFDFIRLYLGLDPIAPLEGFDNGAYGPQTGDFVDDIYLGLDYGINDFVSPFEYEAIKLAPMVPGIRFPQEGLTVETDTGEEYLIANQFMVYDEANEVRFHIVLHSWQLNLAAHPSVESSLHELLYLALHWFNTPEERPELLGRSCKITLNADNPVIGNAYLIQAEIANLGGVPGGGTVRFMDGNTLIKSENVYLNPDRTTTLEALWKPLYAGDRTLSVWIDRYDDYDEVFDMINNIPFIEDNVFFFWDDMENGDNNWEHDSTILRINGEGTLDYMGEPTYTNIEREWLAMNGFHINTEVENTVIQNESYSAPVSFYMYEPNLAGTARKDIDMVMMLDTSGSMDDEGWDPSIGDYQPIGNLKIAARNVVDRMLPEDRLAIFTFDGSGNPVIRQSFTYMTEPNRQATKGMIDGLVASGYTPLWDAIGNAINYAQTNKRTTNVYTSIISMTDGDDYGRFGREDGSTEYCPGSEPGTHFSKFTWGTNLGLRWGDPDYDFDRQDGMNGHDVIRVGGDGATMMGTWLDLWDETRTGLIYSPIPTYTVGLGIIPHEENPLAPSIGSLYYMTSEYDLRKIAETSDAEYLYTSTSGELDKIFQYIFQQVEQEAQASTRAGEPTRKVGPWTDGDEVSRDKWMHTSIVDLSDADSAQLSFKHKYNMKVGSNGGIILVGTFDEFLGLWQWEYIQPDQPYTGNYLVEAWDFLIDDFGQKMRWCYNGLSGGGTLDWDHVTVDLDKYVGEEIIVAFYYIYLDGGTGYGWMVDDVSIKMSTDDDNPGKDMSTDGWRLLETALPGVESYSGTHAWWVGDMAVGGDLLTGVDNSLYTRQIDLTNARTATLRAMLRFNIATAAGRPPDGFRIEVSIDNKETWIPLNLGVRASWGVSGTEDDASDGIDGDKKSYTGLDVDGNGNNWVPAYTLTRVNTNLKAFTGNVINLRFRLVTNTNPTHYADPNQFMGVYIDDVFIFGESLESTRGEGEDEIELGNLIADESTGEEEPFGGIREERSEEVEEHGWSGPSDQVSTEESGEEGRIESPARASSVDILGILPLASMLAVPVLVAAAFVRGRKFRKGE
ncbi:MAG: VWA domain-containing protein [Thermoplasmatota archaeon]